MAKDVVIGKYAIESLTTGMYTDPFVIYREYIQNATDAIDEAIKQIPMKRCGKPEEVAELAAFLASEKSSYITGQVIGINGGIC